ncbi:MAG: T9SS type A sorting domain-containing protein [candidate division Zixibacteria bacterium]|nr:T9SS type A sorting domain-containing protein [candidate division Zixibacteria bacterium]
MRQFGSVLNFVLTAALIIGLMPGAFAMEESSTYAARQQLTADYPGVQFSQQTQNITRIFGRPMVTGSDAVSVAEQFKNSYAQVFGVTPEDLKPESILRDKRHVQPVMYLRETGEYKFTMVYYSQYHNGIPVYRSDLRLLMRNEPGYPVVWAGSALKDLSNYDISSVPSVNRTMAESAARTYLPDLENMTEPRLVIWAGVDEMVGRPTVAMEFVADNGRFAQPEFEKYRFLVDAVSGEVVYYENMILNVDVDGSVHGMATDNFAADICDDEVEFGMPWGRVYIQNGNTAYADQNGDFTIPNGGSTPVTVYSHMRGEWFRVFPQQGTALQLYETVTPPGPVNFLHNSANTQEFDRAQVNGYLQANVVRDFVITYNPSYPGLDQNEFPVNVNLSSTCNAYYDYSSINFYASGGGCPNTAYGTIIHHEYGHHLVAMAGSGQGQYGEGQSDVMGVLITDDPGLAYGFFSNCNEPLRSADNDMQYPCTGQIHYCGQLLSGCVWDTRNELAISNPSNYIDIIANLAVNAILMHTGDMITPDITIDYLTLDDDDGNIGNGTPHYSEICTGFGMHNMDCPPLDLIGFDYPNGLPEYIDPNGGTVVRLEVFSVTEDPVPGSGQFYYNDGNGWQNGTIVEVSQNVYDATFPAVTCGDNVQYYFSAEASGGMTINDPYDAPAETYNAISAVNVITVFEDNFETDEGWTVENQCSDGQWERAIPAGGGDRGDPPYDYDGSGNCYVTDNADDNSDVDDGYTWLMSPTLNLSSGDAVVSYALWYTNNTGSDPNNDLFKVYVSNDNGANWTLAVTHGPVTSSGWNMHNFKVGDFVTPNNQVKVRFEASDLGSGSIVEAGIDAFKVDMIQCEPPADVLVDMFPYNPPVQVYAGGSFAYMGRLENTTQQNQVSDVWVMLGLPGGDTYGPVQSFMNVPLGPEQVITVPYVSQYVPTYAPLGTYDYTAYCGEYPSNPIDSSTFQFSVIGVLGNSDVDGWNLSSWFGGGSENLPARTELKGNYPNPFNATTTISYALASDSDVSLEIYNLMGQKVETIISENQTAGYKTVTWDASGYSSGVYFYKLSAGNEVFTKRLTLLK